MLPRYAKGVSPYINWMGSFSDIAPTQELGSALGVLVDGITLVLGPTIVLLFSIAISRNK